MNGLERPRRPFGRAALCGALLGGLSGSYLAGRGDSAAAQTRSARAYAAPAHTHRHTPRPVERVTVYKRVYIALPEPRNITTRGGGRGAARAHRDPFTSCRMLEDGLAPVYACRTPHGDWKVLQ